MTDSSTTSEATKGKNAKDGDETQKGEAQKQVPLEALANERAQKRAAREEAEATKAELQQARETPNVPDAIIQQLAAEARKVVEAELAPWKERAMRAELGVKHGLNEQQVQKVVEIRGKNPTLTDEQALTLARAEHQALFAAPAQSWNRAVHGGLPVTGTSDARNATAADDYLAKMHQAVKDGDRAAAQHYATEEALKRFRNIFNERPIR